MPPDDSPTATMAVRKNTHLAIGSDILAPRSVGDGLIVSDSLKFSGKLNLEEAKPLPRWAPSF